MWHYHAIAPRSVAAGIVFGLAAGVDMSFAELSENIIANFS